MTVELSRLNCRFLFASQTFRLLETLCKQTVLLFTCSLNSLLPLNTVLISFLFQPNVLTIRRLEPPRLPCLVLWLSFTCTHFTLNLWFTFPLPQFLHDHVTFILELLNLFCFLPCLKNLLHVSVFFVLEIVNTVLYFLFVESCLFKRKFSSLGCRLEVMLNESLSISLGTGLRVVWFVGLKRFGRFRWSDWPAWPCRSATFVRLSIVVQASQKRGRSEFGTYLCNLWRKRLRFVVDWVLFQTYTVVTLLLGHHYAIASSRDRLVVRGFCYNFTCNY